MEVNILDSATKNFITQVWVPPTLVTFQTLCPYKEIDFRAIGETMSCSTNPKRVIFKLREKQGLFSR